MYGSHQCCYDSGQLLLCENWCTETISEDHHTTVILKNPNNADNANSANYGYDADVDTSNYMYIGQRIAYF